MKGIKIILSVLLCFITVFMSSCFAYTSFDELVTKKGETTTVYEYNTTSYYDETTAIVIPATTALAVPVPETTAVQVIMTEPQTTRPAATVPQVSEPFVTLPDVTQSAVTEPQTNVPSFTLPPADEPQETEPDETEAETTPEGTTADSSEEILVYTTKQVIEAYEGALNKTRSYRDVLTVKKTENFTAEVKEAYPGGALTELLANNIVKLVGSEGQQTLTFLDGKAVDSEGETVPVLLPKNDVFSLPEEGVASAVIKKSGDKTHIRITLVPETVKMGEVPKYNSKAIGYLNTAAMDFKIITISRVDITYTGSVIEAVIRSDGYIESVNYTINMSTYAELSGMGISGYGTIAGTQTENWALSY